ncbi:MAG: FGGY family carbohydrate kinase [Sagittula sp.]|uniref:FGGY family carbohydrate kinase n=1 Tax=Sagittula sp. TaxID=2038081 RepID=UPI004058901E
MRPRIIFCLDSGTTSVKAAAFDLSGRLVAEVERPNDAMRRQGDRVEQDMPRTLALAWDVLRSCAKKAEGSPEGLVLTGQGDGLWALDAAGAPVGPALTWLDGRARGMVAELEKAVDRVEAITASRPTAAAQSLQLLWLQRHEPDRLARIHHALRLKEWLFHELTGQLVGEPTVVLPLWGNWRTGALSRDVQDALGLDRGIELLPEMKAVGEARAPLTSAAAALTGLPDGLPVLMGPGDVQATLIGIGLGTRKEVSNASVFGTSAIHACLRADPDGMPETPRGAMIQKFVIGEGYLCVHPCFNGASLLSHLADRFANLPERVAPTRSGIVLHPFMAPGGERTPWTEPQASTAIFGLTSATTPEQIAWAGREALSFAARTSHDMMGTGEGALALGGGLARDAAFAGFLATVTGRTVLRSPTSHAGPRGLAAVAAKHLLGASNDDIADLWIGAPEERVQPATGPEADYARAKFDLFRDTLADAARHWTRLAALGAMNDPDTENDREIA